MTLELAAARKDEQVHAEARAVAEERAARAEAGKTHATPTTAQLEFKGMVR